MRILMALTYYHPHWTGLTAYAKRLAEGLAARGHLVTVLTSQFRPELPLEDELNGVHIVRLPRLMRLSRGQIQPSYIPVFRRLVREHDVVQVHTPMLETWLVGMLAHGAGRKMLMTHHGDLVMPQGFWNQFVQMTVGFLLNRGAAAADVISIHSQDYADHSAYLQPFAKKVVAIYPPAEIPSPDAEASLAWRRELGLDGAPLIGFAGRFVSEKGFDYLLQAIPAVVERFPNAKFIYAGDNEVVYEGFYQSCLPYLEPVRDHVIMAGLITDQQRLANFYGMCDVFALPSRTDCFPSVQIEALLCGTPVVTTNIPGAREVLKVTEMGRLVEPHSPQAIADGLIDVLSAPERYIKSPETIRSIFSLDKTVKAYEDLLTSMVSKS